MIQDICYERIVDNIWFANYFGLKVIMNYDNGYINITKLCSDGGKQFKHWKELKHSKEILSFYERRIKASTADVLGQLDQSISSAVIPADEAANHITVLYPYTGGKAYAYDICRG